MTAVEHTLTASPAVPAPRRELVAEAIAACRDLAHTAADCVGECMGEASAEGLSGCGQSLLNAADVAWATERVLSRVGTDPGDISMMVMACWSASRTAREQCRDHVAGHYRYGLCVRACRRVEQVCCDLLGPTP